MLLRTMAKVYGRKEGVERKYSHQTQVCCHRTEEPNDGLNFSTWYTYTRKEWTVVDDFKSRNSTCDLKTVIFLKYQMQPMDLR